MDWLAGALAVFRKDLLLEYRSRYALNLLLMFVLSCLLLVLFAIGQEPVSARVQGALLWMVLLFATAVGLGRAFVSEEERGTALLLRLAVPGSAVYTGKLLVNLLLLGAVDVVAVLALVLLLGARVAQPGLLATTVALGSVGLAGATTFLGAVIARTASRGPLLPVLLFPTLVPLLLSVVAATRVALVGAAWNDAADALLTLFGFGGVVITAAILLFDYVWND